MSDGPEWFVPKRYGYGATPVTWQGWALTIGFALITTGIAVLFARQPLKLFATVVPLLVVFTVICARTTRGGWRWRWGDED
ncbi:MAG TPA: hypothetical protein VF098_04150 [Sphingomicrobium sp.]|jgi:Na+-driven multidrug efflux pump